MQFVLVVPKAPVAPVLIVVAVLRALTAVYFVLVAFPADMVGCARLFRVEAEWEVTGMTVELAVFWIPA